MAFCLPRISTLWLIVTLLVPFYLISLLGGVLRLGNKQLDDRLSNFKERTKYSKNDCRDSNNTDASTHTDRLRNNHKAKPKIIILPTTNDISASLTTTQNITIHDKSDFHLDANDDESKKNRLETERDQHSKESVSGNVPDERVSIIRDDTKTERKHNTTTIDRRKKLQIKFDRIAHVTNKPNKDQKIWELSDFTPQWMKEYFHWHKEKRRTLTEDVWRSRNNTRFLVVQCLQHQDTNYECGNLSERLMPLPYLIRIAYETNRILFIHWTLPADLLYFLRPPVMGIDWRVPVWLQRTLDDRNQGIMIDNKSTLILDDFRTHSMIPLLRVRLKYTSDFAEQYNTLRNINDNDNKKSSKITSAANIEATFAEVFHDVWRILFVPSSHILKGIIAAFHLNKGMTAGEYTSIDLTKGSTKKRYHNGTQQQYNNTLWWEEEVAKDSIECALKLHPHGPFLAVTDNINSTKALQDVGNKMGTQVYARYKHKFRKTNGLKEKELESQTITDLDSDASGSIHCKPDPFYDIFINLYLMGMGHCVVTYHGQKGVSLLATLIGYNTNCYVDSLSISGPRCEFNEKIYFAMSEFTTEVKPVAIGHYFSAPMLGDGADYIMIQSQKDDNNNVSSSMFDKKKDDLPPWMEEYFAWHRSTKSGINSSNWNSTHYLILSCFESYDHCGGISDRLRPLPMLVWEAYQSQRVLLIWWNKPKPLEDWLVPPIGDENIDSVDWTVPAFLKDELKRTQPKLIENKGRYTAVSWNQGKSLRGGGNKYIAIAYCIQSPDAGESWYIDEQILHAKNSDGSSANVIGGSYQDVFHHLFRRFFTPSPRLADLLEIKMKNHNLTKGHYSAVHLRAMYGRRDHRDSQELVDLAVLGVNCASNLYPGASIYFASDTSYAVQSAYVYGKLHNLPIVSLDYNIIKNNETNNNEQKDLDPSIVESQQMTNENDNPIHLDKDINWRNRTASEYDSTFIDLYMLAESRCVAFSNGGYGTFGSLLSYDSECKMRFFKGKHKIKKCIWMSANRKRHKLEVPNATSIDIMIGGAVV